MRKLKFDIGGKSVLMLFLMTGLAVTVVAAGHYGLSCASKVVDGVCPGATTYLACNGLGSCDIQVFPQYSCEPLGFYCIDGQTHGVVGMLYPGSCVWYEDPLNGIPGSCSCWATGPGSEFSAVGDCF